MAKPLSLDFRDRLFRSVEAGVSCHATAKQFAVSASCVIKLMQRYRQEDTVEPRKFGGGRWPALEPHYGQVRALVATAPGITIDELLVRLAEGGIHTSSSPLGRCLLASKLTRKKDAACRGANSARRCRRP